MKVDLDLIRKYNRALPRYTSYPTAPHFSRDVGREAFAAEVTATNGPDSARPLSLYLHLPFCRQLCYYCGCHMRVTQRRESIAKYVAYLKREIAQTAVRLHPGREVVQIHWGGGTPTYLSPGQIEDLGGHLRQHFHVAPDAEISIEADPRGLTDEHLRAARRVGFNRISIGVQDLDPEVQAAINRIQPEPMIRDAIERARQAGFENLNLDLVYGLPHQTVERFAKTIDSVIDISPNRIALFSYAHMPSVMKHQRLIPDETLPDAARKLTIFKRAIERLTGSGTYRLIGMDHFAKHDDELAAAQEEGTLYRNFQGYSTHAGADVYAFGVSGIHQLHGMYAQNVKGLRDYYRRVDERMLPVYRGYRLTPEDHLRRHVITQLMCNFTLEKAAVEARFGIDFEAHFEEPLRVLASLAQDDLVALTDEAITVRPAGRLLIRNIAAPFDAYYQRPAGAKQPAYSQSV